MIKQVYLGMFLCFLVSFPISAQQTLVNVKNDTIQTNPEVASDSIVLNVEVIEQIELQRNPSKINDGEVSYAKILSKFNLKDSPEVAKYDSLWLSQLYANASQYNSIYDDVSQMEMDTTTYIYNLDTDTLKARLATLNQKSPFNIAYNPSLENVIKMFLTRKRDFIERMLVSSQFYFPMFEQELDNYDIPLEIKYLAIIESALNPRAKSRVGATGLWQFMYGTGKMLDLDVSSYVDERSDPIKSTKAACQYLAKLYNIFGDWDLVLAAYNSGPGNVNKAIRRSGGYTNYWNIRNNLPRETAGYVPAFLAVMYIFEYAKDHGLTVNKVDRPFFETDTIRVKRMITFDQISELVGVDNEELEVLNPSYKLNIIPFVDGKDYTLRLPVAAVGKFVNNEDAIYAQVAQEIKKEEIPLPQLVTAQDRIHYKVKSGDFLGKIAEKYGVGVSQIKSWNGLRSNNLRIGQRLTIYTKKPVTSTKTASTSSNTASKTSIPDGTKIHTVQQGDSLWIISKKYPGITVDNLKDWNGIQGSDLKPGTVLKLCDCSS